MPEIDDIPRVLARNNACHQCRKRKLKCDAHRPTCNNCSKPRMRGAAAHQPAEACTWDAAKPEGRRRSPTTEDAEGSMSASAAGGSGSKLGKRSKLDDLESRLAAFEHNLQDGQTAPTYQPPTSNAANPEQWHSMFQRPVKVPRQSADDEETPLLFTNWHANADTPVSTNTDIVWPDWPRDLPSAAVVQHMVGLFFEKIPTLPKMFHKATFMSQLKLPPSHYAFPCPALLHAILAIIAPHMSEHSLSLPAYYPIGTPSSALEHPIRDLNPDQEPARLLGFGADWRYYAAESPLAKFQLWHRRKAFETSPMYFDRGEKLLQCVQAHIVATAVDQYNAWWVDLWMEAGACVRMAVPLGLNETKNHHPDSLTLTMPKQLLRPAFTPQEHAERVRTWWMVYLLERTVSFSTIWPNALDDAEITVELPVTQGLFDFNTGNLAGSQTLQCKEFYTALPPEHGDSLNLLIKATRLHGDVNRFFRRYSRGPHSTISYAADPTLRMILSRITSLRLGLPAHLRKPGQMLNGVMDVDLVAAVLIMHSSSIVLSEPMINIESWTHDISRMCLSAIRAVLSVLYDITATSFDITLLPSAASWSWAISARCLLRFVGAAESMGDTVSVNVFRSEIEVFRLSLQRYGERYPVGQKHLAMVDGFIESTQPGTSTYGQSLASLTCPDSQVFRPVSHDAIAGYGSGSVSSSKTTPSLASLSTPPSGFVMAPNTSGPYSNSENATAAFHAKPPVPVPDLQLPPPDQQASASYAFANDSGFDISSFSFDFDAISELFSADTTFNGADFVFK